MRLLFLSVSLLVLACCASSARADRVTLLWLQNRSSPSTGSGTVYEAVSASSVGVGYSRSLELAAEIETGLYFLPRNFASTGAGLTGSTSGAFLQVPLAVRLWMNRYVSLLGGFYGAYGLGTLRNTSDFGGGPISSDIGYSAFGLKRFDLGLLAGLGIDIPIVENVGIAIDGRYGFGLTNASADISGFSSTSSWKHRDLTILLGLRLGERDRLR
ncbi:MAG TPA: outer membrane beta-barrel protein [Bdellovibrionota bacterium]|nr:outer membrane beta-barrel protein [Bdellovibrionota bacterium]